MSNTTTFVTNLNGFDIFQTGSNNFQAVKKDSKPARNIVAQFEDTTLISIAQRCMNGQKFASVQLQRIKSAILKHAPQEYGRYFQIAH